MARCPAAARGNSPASGLGPSVPALLAAMAAGLTVLGPAPAALAQDPFEIQVYDSQVLPYGNSMAEFHLIAKPAVTNPPANVVARDPGVFHDSIEPQLGLGHHLETALYIESGVWPDGSFHVSGAKARLKWKLWFSDQWPVRLAINAEIGRVDTNSDDYAVSGEIRPILEIPLGACQLFINANLGVPLGHDWRAGPAFEPQGKFNCRTLADLAPGVEYYTVLGPVFGWLPLAKQTHYLFYTLDLYRWQRLELNVGLGQPLTDASGPWIVNSNLGVQFP